MVSRHGGADRVSTKTKLEAELRILGEVIANAREGQGLRQSSVAAALGLPASYLSKVENGTRRLDVVEFIRIAEAIGTDPSALIRDLQEALRRAPVSTPALD